jgi:hypothetical protein
VRQLDRLRPAGHRHPRGIAGEPEADPHPARHGGRCDGERLVEAFERLGAAGDLDDERAGGSHVAQATIWRVHTFYIALLALTAVVITWFAGFVVYRLVKTPR